MAVARWTEEELAQHVKAIRREAFKPSAAIEKPSKYRNVRCEVNGEKFDSKREAAYWQELLLREKAGQITDVKRQVPFDLHCPSHHGAAFVVARFVADFTFRDVDPEGDYGRLHIADVKGGKVTQMFALKAKWMNLEYGIDIEVVR